MSTLTLCFAFDIAKSFFSAFKLWNECKTTCSGLYHDPLLTVKSGRGKKTGGDSARPSVRVQTAWSVLLNGEGQGERVQSKTNEVDVFSLLSYGAPLNLSVPVSAWERLAAVGGGGGGFSAGRDKPHVQVASQSLPSQSPPPFLSITQRVKSYV